MKLDEWGKGKKMSFSIKSTPGTRCILKVTRQVTIVCSQILIKNNIPAQREKKKNRCFFKKGDKYVFYSRARRGKYSLHYKIEYNVKLVISPTRIEKKETIKNKIIIEK